MKVLITGGAGYIGSTICSALTDQGHTPIILDSLITGKKEFTKDRVFYQGDIADVSLLKKIFSTTSICWGIRGLSSVHLPRYMTRFPDSWSMKAHH
jgi:UDP-glucose 4-epimerase